MKFQLYLFQPDCTEYYTISNLCDICINRIPNFSFYIWRRLFKAHYLAKYVFAIASVPVIFSINTTLEHKAQIWRLGLFFAVFLVVVPNRLFEFRYFIAPYFFWRLNVSGKLLNFRVIMAELLTFLVINLVTIYVFLYYPFEWAHEEGTQRFMW